MNGKHTRHGSGARVRRMKDRTDIGRLRRTTDAEVARAARRDPDAPILPRRFWKDAALFAPRGKRQVTLRLDADVLDFFRKDGRGYQTRINTVLRAFVAAHARRG